MDWLAIALLVIFALNIIVSILCAKMSAKEEAKKSAVLYCLYKEIERYNNNAFVEEAEVKKC